MAHTTPTAYWPPRPEERSYYDANARRIAADTKGARLAPRQNALRALSNAPNQAELLASTRFFSNLPSKFFQAHLEIQNSRNPIPLPKIMEDKHHSVRYHFEQHTSFNQPTGALHPSRWRELGWASKAAYEAWLDERMLYAFSHCLHYCEAPRILTADTEKNERSTGHFYFKTEPSITTAPKTNILSLTGFEFRNYRGSIAAEYTAVQHHSKITMQQILMAAEATQTTDIVLIPYGMGVFLPDGPQGEALKAKMLAGMSEALKAYRGRPITIHCCGWDNFYTHLSQNGANPNIQFENQSGKDAYILANTIQDAPDDRKSMLINAGDNDWTTLLDPTKKPGQLANLHTLYHSTSDEYYGLVTAFTHFCIQNLLRCFGAQIRDKMTYTPFDTPQSFIPNATQVEPAALPRNPTPNNAVPTNYRFLLNCLGAISAAISLLLIGTAIAALFPATPLGLGAAAIAAGGMLITGAASFKFFQAAGNNTTVDNSPRSPII